jgi:hypothetical protein
MAIGKEVVVMQRLDYFRSRESLLAKRRSARASGDCEGSTRVAALWSVWRFAAIEVEIAFDQWCAAPAADDGRAYAIYVDSLRRESEAAERLAERHGSATSISA